MLNLCETDLPHMFTYTYMRKSLHMYTWSQAIYIPNPYKKLTN